MKVALLIILGSMAVAVVFSLIINLFSAISVKSAEQEGAALRYNLICDYSLKNAMSVNHSISHPNSPVRPEGEDFFDGMISEISETRSQKIPECKIINIRNVVSANALENTHGSL